MEFLVIILRALFISFIFLYILRKKGRRKLQLISLVDFVFYMVLVHFSANAVLAMEKPFLLSLAPFFLVLSMQFLYQRLNRKGEKKDNEPRRIADYSMPIPVIIDGKVQEDQLLKVDKTSLWIRQQMRHLGYRDIKKISYCAIKD